MPNHKLEDRVKALEDEVARLKSRLDGTGKKQPDWLETAWGAFANDPIYDEAMRLGKKYRDSQRPKPAKRRKR
jgi:hypothetical protein